MISFPKYCSQCSQELVLQRIDGRSRPVCQGCGQISYLNPIPSVATILFQDGRILLVKRNIEPGYGKWGLPGGFIERDESPNDAVIREVFEETGLICQPINVIDTSGSFETIYGSIIVICYLAEIISGTLRAGDDAEDVQFFELNSLPPMAFRNHTQFLEKYAGFELASHDKF